MKDGRVAASAGGGSGAAGRRLGVGVVGSGFSARFHMRGWIGVRDADVLGVWSPNPEHAADAAVYARDLGVGEAGAHGSIGELVENPDIDALWICGPNHARVENVRAIAEALEAGRGELVGVACEKPLARTVAEAERVRDLGRDTGLSLAYLENQVFAPAISRGRELIWKRGAAIAGRPYLARAAEEHSGPHMPWFWDPELQGGGVLNDMMCHSAELVRFLLTEPGAPRSSLALRRVRGDVAHLKWTRPEYVRRLSEATAGAVDYGRRPAEDFASVLLEFETGDGAEVVGEATTSWSFVGAGLRLSAELLGPEYSMAWDTLDPGLSLFFSREVKGEAGEDLVEKQNAEVGVMPVVADEAVAYGYQAEDRHVVRAFLAGEEPLLTWDDGLEVVKILMTAYMSAEEGRTLDFPPPGLEGYVPEAARERAEG